MGVWRYSSIHSAVDGGEWLALRSDRFISGEAVSVNIYLLRLMGLRASLNALGKRQISCTCQDLSHGPSNTWPGERQMKITDRRFKFREIFSAMLCSFDFMCLKISWFVVLMVIDMNFTAWRNWWNSQLDSCVPANFVLDNVIEDSAEIAVADYIARTPRNIRFASNILISPYHF
jgi:hypothetical protein